MRKGIILCAVLTLLSGCMQATGMKKIKLGTWEFESNSGFEVSAGAMQYDHALDRKGMNVEAEDNRKLEKY